MTPRAERHPGPWVVWGSIVMTTAGVVGVLSSAVLRWPRPSWIGFVVGAIALPIAALGATGRFARHGRSVLITTIPVVGALLIVCVLFVAVPVALGNRPTGDERQLFAGCVLAALVACAAVPVAGRRLHRWADAAIGSDRTQPDRMVSTLSGRMTRSIPMDELLLQVVETLHRTLALSTAEIWTGEGGRLTRAASLPERGPGSLQLRGEALDVVTRAGAQGNAWLEVWIPELLQDRDQTVRSVSIRHRGELLGLLVMERPGDAHPFTADEDGATVDLARSLGLALHNVRLDSALRASVSELERRNVELRDSRARVVAVADDARRRIERDLHDGAQQRLVGLAVQIGLIRSASTSSPEQVGPQLDQLAVSVDEAIEELRELAHGIYPPRLRDRGLVDALRTATLRSGESVAVEATGVGRYAPDVEAAVYFCCLEAIHNATKHAGPADEMSVRLRAHPGTIEFEITDDGIGFDPTAAATGQGLVNMQDRVGAIGGEITVRSEPGQGTTVTGSVPAHPSGDE